MRDSIGITHEDKMPEEAGSNLTTSSSFIHALVHWHAAFLFDLVKLSFPSNARVETRADIYKEVTHLDEEITPRFERLQEATEATEANEKIAKCTGGTLGIPLDNIGYVQNINGMTDPCKSLNILTSVIYSVECSLCIPELIVYFAQPVHQLGIEFYELT